VRHEEVPYSVRRNWQNGWDGYAFEVDRSHTWFAVDAANDRGAFTREQYYEVLDEYRKQKLAKGEAVGHKFRGNQHTGGIGGGGPKKTKQRSTLRDRLRSRLSRPRLDTLDAARWAEQGQSPGKAEAKAELEAYGGRKPKKGETVRAKTVDEAVKALAEGYHVELSSKREVSTLLSKLKEIVDDAVAKGEKAPTYDLCKVSVPGTNLFCTESKGIPRLKMPQFTTKTPVEGSEADKQPRDNKGRVNLAEQFVQHMESKGIDVSEGSELASYLKATQNELDGANVAGMVASIKDGSMDLGSGSIFVSADNYVIDGHHRWAAAVAVDLEDNKEGDIKLPIRRVNASILDVLVEANQFTEDWGIPGVGIGADLKKRTPCLGCNDEARDQLRFRLLG
jgi:hypothetical protein